MEFDELFKLTSDDYSIKMLERLFGGIISTMRGEGGDPEDLTMLSTIVGLVNQFCGLIAVLVVAFTTYTVIFDTAADGTTFGKSADTKYTILRVSAGIVAFIPVAGGFSLAQLGALYLMIGGSAFADTIWTETSEQMVAGNSFIYAPEPIAEADFLVRGEFARAMQALTSGYVCALHMNRIAEIENVAGGTTAVVFNPTSTPRSRSTEIYFRDADGEYGSGDNLCGSVTYDVTFSERRPELDNLNVADFDFAERIDLIVNNTVYTSANEAVWTVLNPAARDLALEITGYQGVARVRDRVVIENRIRTAVNEATALFTGNVSTKLIPDTELQTYQASVLEIANTSGWVFAANWQRGLAGIYTKLADARANLKIKADASNDIGRYFSSALGYAVSTSSGGTIADNVYQPFVQDTTYLQQFTGFVADLSSPDPGNYVTSMDAFDQEEEHDVAILRWLYRYLIQALAVTEGDTFTWTDPMVDVQEVGNGMLWSGGGILAASAVLDWGSGYLPLGGEALERLSDYVLDPVGWGLVIAGIVFVTVIPMTPLIYFVSAVFSWILLCIEAMFALPIATIVYFAPARESSLIGPWQKIVLTLFGLLLRPAFTVIGLIAALVAARIGLDLLFWIFQGLFSLANPGAGTAGAIFAFVGTVYVFLLLTVILLVWCSSLITELGDSALNWIGAGVSNLGRAPIADRAASMLDPAGAVRGARPTGLPSTSRPSLARQASASRRITKGQQAT